MALIMLMDMLMKSLDNGEFVIGIFLDFSKALDTVDHAFLLEQLYQCGIRGTTTSSIVICPAVSNMLHTMAFCRI